MDEQPDRPATRGTDAARDRLADFLADFRDVPVAFRPVPFWSWNEAMDPAEVARQVDLIADAGWGGAFVHARVGLTIDYLGDAWFRAVDATIERCRARGLKVWLYDEDKWPSGFSGGSVPLADERFRMRALVARRPGDAVPPGCRPLADGDGLVVHEWTATLGNPWFNGTSYSDLMSRDAVRKFLDDGYASYHARYAKEYGDVIVAEFTDEPCTIFRLGVPRGAVPYSTDLPDRFRAAHGYDPLPKLGLLFADAPGGARFRLDYYRTVNDLFEQNFSRQLGEWCASKNIALTGHYMSEHGLYDQQLWGVKVMPNYRHQQIPGIDFLVRQVNEVLPAKQCQSVVNQFGKRRMISELYGVSGQNLSFEDRWWIACQQIALGVNLLNPHLALFTMSGCRKRDYPPNLYYQQPWWPVNAALDVPLGRLCLALSQGRYVAEALVIHPQESAFVAWRGAADVADPATDKAHDFEPTAAGVKPEIARLDAAFKAVLNALLGAQRTFDLGDETILADDADVDTAAGSPTLRVGLSRYAVVVLPEMWTLAATTLALLERFVDAGGVVLRCGAAPTMLDGVPSPRLDAFVARVASVALDDLPAVLATRAPPLVRVTNAPADLARRLLVHVRDLDDGSRLAFLTHLDRTRALDAATLSFRGPWTAARELDPMTGDARDVDAVRDPDGLVTTCTFEPARARLFHLTKGDTGIPACVRRGPSKATQAGLPVALDHEWSVRRLDDNALPLDRAAWREGDGAWSTRPLPVVAIQTRLNDLKYDGPVDLRYAFRVAGLGRGRDVRLVVEYPERYRIRVNGRDVAYAGLPHWRDVRWLPIDVGALVRDGENVVEISCDAFRHGDLTRTGDPVARYGTELEAVYLVGDFGVAARVDAPAPPSAAWRSYGLPPVDASWLDAGSLTLVEPRDLAAGDVTRQGLPFYAGRLALRRTLGATDAPRRLALDQLDAAVATVTFDGRPLGTLVARPFTLDVPRHAGELEVTLHGTLRNLLGPHHHPDGELAAVTPWSFVPKFDERYADGVAAWSAGTVTPRDYPVTPRDYDERYCVVSFGNVRPATG